MLPTALDPFESPTRDHRLYRRRLNSMAKDRQQQRDDEDDIRRDQKLHDKVNLMWWGYKGLAAVVALALAGKMISFLLGHGQ